jgi:hypothetical protein
MGVNAAPPVTLAENAGLDYNGARPLAADWIRARFAGDKSLSGRQVFTENGTFTPPAGVTRVYLTMCGGGAGGRSGTANSSSIGTGGNGGGASPITYLKEASVTQTTYSVTIGAGGGSNSNGGTSSFAGINTSGGVVNGGSSGTQNYGGRGQSSFFSGGYGSGGDGGTTGMPGTAGSAGTSYGAGGGGGGGGSIGAEAGAGGAGKSGIVIIEW